MSFPLNSLSEANLLAVVRKTTPESFVRLRQASKGLNEFAETFSRQIQIHVNWVINLAPNLGPNTRPIFIRPSLLSQINSGNFVEFPTEDSVEMKISTRYPGNRERKPWIVIPLKEAPKTLAGFLLKQIFYIFDNPDVTIEPQFLMAPDVRDKYLNFIAKLNIRCDLFRFHVRSTPWSLIERLNPPLAILAFCSHFNFKETVKLPETTKTILYELVDDRVSSGISLEKPIPMVRSILSQWYAGSTTLKRLQFMQGAILDADLPGSNAAVLFLKKCLEQTPYEDRDQTRCFLWSQNNSETSLAELLIENRARDTAAFCIRYDTEKQLIDMKYGLPPMRRFRVTLYFFADAHEFSGGTEAYYALDCCPGVKDILEDRLTF